MRKQVIQCFLILGSVARIVTAGTAGPGAADEEVYGELPGHSDAELAGLKQKKSI